MKIGSNKNVSIQQERCSGKIRSFFAGSFGNSVWIPFRRKSPGHPEGEVTDMPRKHLKQRITKRRLTPTEEAYLRDDDTGLEVEDFILWCYRHGQPGFGGDPLPKELWEEYRDDFLPEFIAKHPGKRPLPWWQWDAPRWADPYEGCYFHGTLPEPRRRIGGTGLTTWEKYPAVVPSFQKGIPASWHEIDPDDPPRFESEVSYLFRHGLLTPIEIKCLADMPEAWGCLCLD